MADTARAAQPHSPFFSLSVSPRPSLSLCNHCVSVLLSKRERESGLENISRQEPRRSFPLEYGGHDGPGVGLPKERAASLAARRISLSLFSSRSCRLNQRLAFLSRSHVDADRSVFVSHSTLFHRWLSPQATRPFHPSVPSTPVSLTRSDARAIFRRFQQLTLSWPCRPPPTFNPLADQRFSFYRMVSAIPSKYPTSNPYLKKLFGHLTNISRSRSPSCFYFLSANCLLKQK